MPDQSYTLRPQRRWRSRIVLLLLLLALLAVGVWWIWLAIATRQQEVAFQRLRAAGVPATFKELLTELQPVARSSDAAIDVLAAAELLDREGDALTALDEWRIPQAAMSQQEQQQWLVLQRRVAEEQAKAIERATSLDAKIRPAVDAVAADFGVWSKVKEDIGAGNAPENPITILLPHINDARSVANVIAADARASANSGNAQRALRQVIRLAGIADSVDADAYTLVEHLVAIGIRVLSAQTALEIARNGVADAAPELLAQTIAVLLEEDVLRTGFAKALRSEAAFELEAARALDEGRIDISAMSGEASRPVEIWIVRLTRPILRGDAAVVADYHRMLYSAANAVNHPDAVRIVPDYDVVAPNPYFDLYARVLIASMERAVEAEFRCRTDLHLAATALAIAAYRAGNAGEWPDSLEVLVPQYLPALPRDAMAEGAAPIRYDAQRKLLWSVGTNGIDDDGDARSMRQGGGKATHWDGKDAVVELE